MSKGTATFTIHLDRCDPSKWTVREWRLLADYVNGAEMVKAAALSRLGMQLVMDERHVPKGGECEHMGWLLGNNGSVEHDIAAETIDELDIDYVEPVEIVPVYRGQTQFAVQYAIGDGNGNIDGNDFELFDTVEEAQKFADSLKIEAA